MPESGGPEFLQCYFAGCFSVWRNASTSANTFSGLTRGQIYSVDVHAFGSAGQGDWSDTSELMIV